MLCTYVFQRKIGTLLPAIYLASGLGHAMKVLNMTNCTMTLCGFSLYKCRKLCDIHGRFVLAGMVFQTACG